MSLDQIAWVNFQDVIDDSGRLTAIEEFVNTPFSIKRIFYVHQVKKSLHRGGHAHMFTDQIIVGVHGSLKVDVSDGGKIDTYLLDDPGRGLFVPRKIWIKLYEFKNNGICLVLANTIYDKNKSIRSWEDYISHFNLPFRSEP